MPGLSALNGVTEPLKLQSRPAIRNLAHVDRTVMVVCPIQILSPFLSRWAAWMRRLFSQVPLVEPRSSTYQRPWAVVKRA
jgi:hypothetical protein